MNYLTNNTKNLPAQLKLTILAYIFLIISAPIVSADELHPRQYQLQIGQLTELQTIAANSIVLNSLIYDLYYKGISPKISSTVDPYLAPIWSAFWTFNLTMWPHDGGHWSRAEQAGGKFRITQYRFPFPVAEMIDPVDATEAEMSLTSAGGFEINNLMNLQTRIEFYQRNYAYADQLVHAFIQSILFPMYTLAIAPANPEKPDTWTDTYGDPVEYTASVFKHLTGRDEIQNDGSVDPELVDLYREVFWTNLIWTLVDPMLYQSAQGFAVDMNNEPGYLTPWQLGDDNFSWHYGTLFNTSAIGYELYLYNMFKIFGRLYALYFKWGRPFKNRGAGLIVPELYDHDRFSLGVALDAWDQDIFGKGVSLTVQPKYRLTKNWQLSADFSWKDDGYVLGRRLERSYRLLAGINYRHY
jgi:hypothetical protein